MRADKLNDAELRSVKRLTAKGVSLQDISDRIGITPAEVARVANTAKERPILFRAPMVKAIFAGSKTQTRRIIKNDWWRCLDSEDEDDRAQALGACPYGQPGDRLWVRETFYCDDYRYPDAPIEELRKQLEYRASHDCRNWEAGCPCRDENGRSNWRRSIFMPRWASRLLLEVTSVRIERLQDITEEDAQAEGCSGFDPEPVAEGGTVYAMKGSSSAPSPLAHFRWLWDNINGGPWKCWDDNPWLWCVGFKRVDATEVQ